MTANELPSLELRLTAVLVPPPEELRAGRREERLEKDVAIHNAGAEVGQLLTSVNNAGTFQRGGTLVLTIRSVENACAVSMAMSSDHESES